MSPTASIQALRDALHSLQQNQIHITGFCQIWRSQPALLATLPPRYAEVAEDLLGRLEAGSLFTEESCSFSQQDLLDGLTVWLDKAQQKLTSLD